jgi:GTP pyrophosphokinase
MIEIMSTKGGKGPSRDWLSPHLGYVKTSHAKGKIRQWFKKQERAENIERGRELLNKELRHLGLKLSGWEELAGLFKYDSQEDFLLAIGCGSLATHQIALKLAAEREPPKVAAEFASPKPPTSVIKVLGAGDMLTRLAQCCHPVPGDRIIGYVTRSRGVTVHRQDCYNVVNQVEKERLVKVEWGQVTSSYPVSIEVEAWDRVGLVSDISTLVAGEKINIAAVRFVNHDDHTTSTFLTLEVKGLAQLSRLSSKIEGVSGVINVTRVGDEATIDASSESGSAEMKGVDIAGNKISTKTSTGSREKAVT